jgi:hypothetical protein
LIAGRSGGDQNGRRRLSFKITVRRRLSQPRPSDMRVRTRAATIACRFSLVFRARKTGT